MLWVIYFIAVKPIINEYNKMRKRMGEMEECFNAPKKEHPPLPLMILGQELPSSKVLPDFDNDLTPQEIQQIDHHMNIAMREIVNSMVRENLISNDMAADYLASHTVVIACRSRGMSGILSGVKMDPGDIRANRKRVVILSTLSR